LDVDIDVTLPLPALTWKRPPPGHKNLLQAGANGSGTFGTAWAGAGTTTNPVSAVAAANNADLFNTFAWDIVHLLPFRLLSGLPGRTLLLCRAKTYRVFPYHLANLPSARCMAHGRVEVTAVTKSHISAALLLRSCRESIPLQK
jgi:hypothetical protein